MQIFFCAGEHGYEPSFDGGCKSTHHCRRAAIGVRSPVHLQLHSVLRKHQRQVHAKSLGSFGLRIPSVAYTQQDHQRQGSLHRSSGLLHQLQQNQRSSRPIQIAENVGINVKRQRTYCHPNSFLAFCELCGHFFIFLFELILLNPKTHLCKSITSTDSQSMVLGFDVFTILRH